MKDVVSIVIPIYNAEKYIAQCLDSILNQTYKELQVIVVNDGSKDNSLNILESYANKYSNILLIKKENGGVSSARNLGLKYASGKYLAFIDADDYVEPDYIEVLVCNIEKYNADASICGFFQHKRNKKQKQITRAFTIIYSQQEVMKQVLSGKYFTGSLWNKLFKTELLKEQIFNENIHYGEDLLFTFQYLEKCSSVCYNTKKLYHYILNPNSIVRSKFNTKKLSLLESLQIIIDATEKNYKDSSIYAKGWFALVNLELLFYTIRDKYKDKELQHKLTSNIKINLPYLKKGKLFPYYRRALVPIAFVILKTFL